MIAENVGSGIINKSKLKGISAMAEYTPPWEKKNPKKKSKPLTPKQKAKAKALAKNANRPFPNLVDIMHVSKQRKKNG